MDSTIQDKITKKKKRTQNIAFAVLGILTYSVIAILFVILSFIIYKGASVISWDFITQPDAVLTKGVEEILGKQPLVIIAISFVILVGLYWIMKRVTLGFVIQPKNAYSIEAQPANPNTPNTR